MIRYLMSALCFAVAIASGSVSADTSSALIETRETTLENGLKIVVRVDRRAPVVVSQVWYKVGSSDEPEGITGISHVLEHMMFKGTTRYPTGEFSRLIAGNGGRENAFTGRDYTAYFQQIEKSRLPLCLELEADRMRHLTLDATEFGKELRVVMEERRLRTDDQPEGLLYERFQHAAYQTHSYRQPVIGWMRDLEKLTAADLRRWYDRWYRPDNATLVVVGDVVPEQVFALVRTHFGPIPRGAAPIARDARSESPQLDARRVTLAVPAKVPALLMGFHAPAIRGGGDNREAYALMVLAGVLDGGDAARFARSLVRDERVVASVDADYSAYSRYPGLFTIGANPAPGRTVTEVEKSVWRQLQRLLDEPVAERELARVKSQVAASDVFGRDSVHAQAMRIGTLETIGLAWPLADEVVGRIEAVTAEEVRAVARKVFTGSNLTVAILEPQAMAPAAPRGATGGRHAR